jgi:hypothetical protein
MVIIPLSVGVYRGIVYYYQAAELMKQQLRDHTLLLIQKQILTARL